VGAVLLNRAGGDQHDDFAAEILNLWPSHLLENHVLIVA